MALVKQVLESNYLNEGQHAASFEARLAELLGTKHAVAVTSGTAALSLSLVGCGVGHGDEVIVPDLTFIATANAVTMTGAKAVLVDVDPATLNIDPGAIERAITGHTKAVVPVHVSGRAADMGAVLSLAEAHGLTVIEDAAEALLSRHRGRCLGTFGKTGCFSFSPMKTVTTGQGGVIVTDDDDLDVRLRELKDQGRPVRGTGGDDVHKSLGYNFKLTNVQAAIGLAQLARLEGRMQRQRSIYRIYAERLREVPGIRILPFDLGAGECPQWTDALVENRDDLVAYLKSRGADCRKFWHPIHTQAPYRLSDDAFPNSTRLSPHALWLPSAFTLSDEDVDSVCGMIREFCGRA
jgi:perosamine synthetase